MRHWTMMILALTYAALVIGGMRLDHMKMRDAILSEDSSPHTVTFEAAELFQGDTVRLKPHLGWTTGAVKFRYKGDDTAMLGIRYEIWKEGQLVEEIGGFAWSMDLEKKGTISVSIRDTDDGKFKIVTVSQTRNGYTRSEATIDRYGDEIGITSHDELAQPRTITMGEEASIWGWAGGEDTLSSGSVLGQEKPTAKWALVMTAYLKERGE